MRIGELGQRAGVSTKTIRYYESLGLVDEPDRTAAGYRDYDEVAVERLRFVRDAQATGLTLSEIASVLELKGSGQRSCAHTTALLDRHLADLDVQIERLTEARAALQELAAGHHRMYRPVRKGHSGLNRCQELTSPDRRAHETSGQGSAVV